LEKFIFQSAKLPDIFLLADTTRIYYILSILIMKCAKRNDYYHGADMVKVIASVEDDDMIQAEN
jgi:hypothetical protein